MNNIHSLDIHSTCNQQSEDSISLSPERDESIRQAEQFLNLLDNEADTFTFQTFDDNKSRRDHKLSKLFHGTFEEYQNELAMLNVQGAGVFVVVNKTNLQGRKKDDIVEIRAVWQEADRADVPKLPFEPHIEVETSPGKYHRYLLTENAPLDEFESVQQRLVDDYGSDPNAKDRSRVLRLPGFNHMKNPDQPHRVRITRTSGHSRQPWGQLKRLITPVERNRLNIKAERPAPGAPLLQPATIRSAIAYLDPDLSYQDWLTVGMALHSASVGQEAYEIWDAWSKQGESYRTGETEYRWRTFSQDGGVTIKSLLSMASAAGWDGSINTHKDMRIYAEQESSRMLKSFNDNHAVAMIGGQAVIAYRERDGNSNRMTTRFSKIADIKLKFQTERISIVKPQDNGEFKLNKKPLVDTWNQWPLRKTYDQVVFKPIAGLVAGDFTLPDDKVLNLYQGLAIEPKQGDCQPILDHILEVWCSGENKAYAYVVDWLARMMQHPNERGHTVIVLRSGEGTGKNIVVDILVRAFGEHATVAVNSEALTGRFNDHLGTSVLVFANEAVWGGSKDQEGALKSLITDEELPVERKYMPKYRVPNCCHLMMASNNDWVAPVGVDDRRFVILDVNESKKGDFVYFQKLSENINNGGDAAFLDFLMQRNIESFNPRELPDLGLNQSTKRDAKLRGSDSITQWLHESLDLGRIRSMSWHKSNGGWMSFSPGERFHDLTEGWETTVTIPKEALYAAYCDWHRNQNKRHLESEYKFADKMIALINARKVRPGTAIDRDRHRSLELPCLDDCRSHFEAATKMPWPWDHNEVIVGRDLTPQEQEDNLNVVEKVRRQLNT